MSRGVWVGGRGGGAGWPLLTSGRRLQWSFGLFRDDPSDRAYLTGRTWPAVPDRPYLTVRTRSAVSDHPYLTASRPARHRSCPPRRVVPTASHRPCCVASSLLRRVVPAASSAPAAPPVDGRNRTNWPTTDKVGAIVRCSTAHWRTSTKRVRWLVREKNGCTPNISELQKVVSAAQIVAGFFYLFYTALVRIICPIWLWVCRKVFYAIYALKLNLSKH